MKEGVEANAGFAIQLVTEAGKSLLGFYGKKIWAKQKSNNRGDFVSRADVEAERLIINAIHARYPEHSILAEERGHQQSDSPYCWVVDPLDGTSNFLRGIPLFAVSVALDLQGVTVLGVVHNPVTGEIYHAIRNHGAYRNGKRLRASIIRTLEDSVVCVEGGKSRHSIAVAAEHHTLIAAKALKTRSLGSSAISLALVASRGLDGFTVNGLQYWDTAAGALIVVEAGGRVTAMTDESSSQGAIDLLVASGRHIHDALLALVGA